MINFRYPWHQPGSLSCSASLRTPCRLVHGLIALAAAVTVVVGLGASPAHATIKTGGAYSCPPGPPQRFVTTYNYAAGTVYHRKMVGGIWDRVDFGTSLPPLTRYWYKYYNVQGWEVYGTIQENDKSGVSCLL